MFLKIEIGGGRCWISFQKHLYCLNAFFFLESFEEGCMKDNGWKKKSKLKQVETQKVKKEKKILSSSNICFVQFFASKWQQSKVITLFYHKFPHFKKYYDLCWVKKQFQGRTYNVLTIFLFWPRCPCMH